MKSLPYTRAAALPQILKERIVILDGAMGTMIQRHKLARPTTAASASRTTRRA
jgi:5-methyltetrahydrofolate--homocysteine methyltransferase